MRGPRKRRGIKPEDRAIWEQVIRSVSPLSQRPAPTAPRDPPPIDLAPIAEPPVAEGAETTLPRRIVKPAGAARPAPAWHGPRPRHPQPVGRPEPGLDKRTAERLRRGERAPDARIDLHGMTAECAHRALDRFIGAALGKGHRCILVITGKGGRRHSGDDAPFMRPEAGVLREAAPNWLRTGPYANSIVGIFAAHIRHGGAGAFYVYLKKPR